MKIYLTNNATVLASMRPKPSAETQACAGPGLVLSIMRWPRRDLGEAGAGRVLAFTPPRGLALPAIRAKKGAGLDVDGAAEAWRGYEEALRWIWSKTEDRFAPGVLSYGELVDRDGLPWDGERWRSLGVVPDGATLVCACSRAAAAAGRCHRVIAADFLRRAGWSVVLDGRVI